MVSQFPTMVATPHDNFEMESSPQNTYQPTLALDYTKLVFSIFPLEAPGIWVGTAGPMIHENRLLVVAI